MLNFIWIAMLVIGLVFGIINGTITEVTNAGFTAAGDAVMFCLGLMGIMCLWCGFVKIAHKAGLMEVISKIFRPLVRKLFPDISHDDNAVSAIIMNFAANVLGLGNAATPLGINACKEIKRAEQTTSSKSLGDKYKATRSICLFVIINTVSIQLIPTTVIAMRGAAGSTDPSGILVHVWIVSGIVCVAGVIMAKICEKFVRR